MTVIDSECEVDAPNQGLPASMIERMTLILDAFDGRGSRLTLEEVAGRARLPRSTVHRILHQMVRLNWIEHAAYGYRLGGRALALGGDGGRGQIRAAAAPLLHELHQRTGVVVHLTVLEGADCVYLDKIGGPFAAQVPSRVGGRVPAYATAAGKAMLARLAPETVDQIYGRALPGRTERTISERTVLHRELHRIRQRSGLAFDIGESSPGVGCAGAAVRGPDGPVAAISLCADEESNRIERIAPLVVDAARAVSRILHPDLAGPADRPRPIAPGVRSASFTIQSAESTPAEPAGAQSRRRSGKP
ncbi:IclR family transcriptional regulator [Nocardia sp. NPDC024068]|uniref:IclR family transcriptional regulator n=1 Tax=Nocardia sp. NPDC024068 TaxID=3157197 RepID=UPI0033CC77E5